MKHRFTSVLIISVIFLSGLMHLSLTYAQENEQITALVIELNALDWQNRSMAITELQKAPDLLQEPLIKENLIRLLEKENAYNDKYEAEFEKTGIPLGEGYGEYYIQLVQVVVSLNTPQSINALAGALGVSDQVATAVAQFGKSAIEPLQKRLIDTDQGIRRGAVRALGIIISKYNQETLDLSGTAVETIKDQLINAIHDESPWVRIQAIKTLSKIGGKDLIPVLREVAENDTYSKRREIEGGIIVYPVQDAAKTAIKSLGTE